MTLLVEQFKYHKLSRDESSGVRLYACPDGHKVPSVTTVLDATKPQEAKEALARWKASVGKEKAQEITTMAASRGTRMHKNLEDYIAGIPLNDSASNPYAQQGLVMARSVIENGLSNVTEVWGSEVPLYYPELYAGTTDCVGVHQNIPSIIDFKQTNKPKKREWITDYFLQLAFYANAHNAVYGTDIKRGVIMMSVAPQEKSPGNWDTPQYQEFIVEGAEWAYFENMMWDRLEQYYRKMYG